MQVVNLLLFAGVAVTEKFIAWEVLTSFLRWPTCL